MRRFVLVLFSLVTLSVNSQDSTKIITQEVGFNTVLLVKQLVSNNPTSVLPQLPYAVFYNIYFKDLVGARIGFGYSKFYSETDIEGQPTPRTLDQINMNLRVGASYNFVRSRRITCNVFADYVTSKSSVESANTSTIQSFPNPIETLTVKSLDETLGKGAQVGVGVKYNLYKNLSIYTEIPFTYLSQKIRSELLIINSGVGDLTTSSSKATTTNFTLPTTVYLVLRF